MNTDDGDLAVASKWSTCVSCGRRMPLPAGSVIGYLGETATVVYDDGGETLEVEIGGDHMRWSWTFEGESCEVVSLPENAAEQRQSEPTK